MARLLREVLAQPEFQQPLGERTLRAVLGFLEELMGRMGFLGPLVRLVLILGCLALLVLLAVRAVRLYLNRGPRQPGAPRGPARPAAVREEASAVELLEHARALASAGQVREAARALQQALLVHLCQLRNIPFRPTVTDWEWMGLLSPPTEFVECTRRTQRLAFGPEPGAGELASCVERVGSLVSRPRGQQ